MTLVLIGWAWLTSVACAGGGGSSPPASGSERAAGEGIEEGAAVPTESGQSETTQPHGELFELVRQHGEVRLIVGLASGGALTPIEVAALVDTWLVEMPAGHVRPGRRFQSMPSLVVTVDATGLEAVVASQRVESIELDELSSPPEPP